MTNPKSNVMTNLNVMIPKLRFCIQTVSSLTNILSSQCSRQYCHTNHNTTTSSMPNYLSHSSKEEDASTLHGNNTSARMKKLFITIPLLSLLLFVMIDSQTSPCMQSAFQSLLAWISAYLVNGIFALITVYIHVMVAFIPGSIFTLGSGFINGQAFGLGYGVVITSGVVFGGACGSPILSLLFRRYLERMGWGEVSRELSDIQSFGWGRVNTMLWNGNATAVFSSLFFWCHDAIQMWQKSAFKQKGFQIFVLLSLCPIIPFNVINYIGGVPANRLKDYTCALFETLPGTVLHCVICVSAVLLVSVLEVSQKVKMVWMVLLLLQLSVRTWAAAMTEFYYHFRIFNFQHLFSTLYCFCWCS